MEFHYFSIGKTVGPAAAAAAPVQTRTRSEDRPEKQASHNWRLTFLLAARAGVAAALHGLKLG